MRDWDRRKFLSSLSIALIPVAAGPRTAKGGEKSTCWLEVCAPLIVEDSARGIHSEIILTSDTFAGARGHDQRPSFSKEKTGNAQGDNDQKDCGCLHSRVSPSVDRYRGAPTRRWHLDRDGTQSPAWRYTGGVSTHYNSRRLRFLTSS